MAIYASLFPKASIEVVLPNTCWNEITALADCSNVSPVNLAIPRTTFVAATISFCLIPALPSASATLSMSPKAPP